MASFAFFFVGTYLAWTLDEAKKVMLRVLPSEEDWFLIHEEWDGYEHLWGLYSSTTGGYVCGIWRTKIVGALLGD